MSAAPNLNPAQREAVNHTDGPLLIVAGAGTGKTTVIAQRLAWLIEQKLAKPNEILALTFTDKAAGEMEERVDQLLPYGFLDLWVQTFHAFGERLLKSHGLDIGISNDFKLLTSTDTWLLVRENLDKFDLDYYRPLGNPTKFIHALLKHFSRCKDEMVTPAEYLKYAENLVLDSDSALGDAKEILGDEKKRLNEIANAYHTYNQVLLDNNALDFGDLINYTLKLFQTRPKILESYRRQFKYILVDEFQDTNLAQYELIKILAAPKNNITVVGDDSQAIYKFRGASISNILHFKDDYPTVKLVTLINNYRSTQAILDKARQVIINNNPDSLEVKLKINKKLIAQKPITGQIEKIHARTGTEEARQVVEKIQTLKLSDESAGLENSWNDFAILTRSNATADSFMNALEQAGVPFQFLASKGLYREGLVLDIISYLKLLDNYHENPAMWRVLNMPFWEIATNDIVKITHQAKKKTWSIFETLKHASAFGVGETSVKNIAKMLGLVAKHAELARRESIGKVAYAFLNDSGYLKNLVTKSAAGEQDAMRQVMFLKQYYDTIIKFEEGNIEKLTKHYLAYLHYVLESGEEGSLRLPAGRHGGVDEEPEAVKIMTVHSAKGLEFKHVFIVNLVEQKFPSTNRSESIELPDKLVKEILPEGDIHLQEERRLFYVAITRAKESIFFCHADDYGGTRQRKPSRFLTEIGFVSDRVLKKDKKDALDSLHQPTRANNQKAAPANIPTHFSFTQLKAFATCPLQYRLAHILHIPVKGSASFSFGKTMHLALQRFYQKIIELNSQEQGDLFTVNSAPVIPVKTGIQSTDKIKIPSLEDLLNFYESAWIDDWYENKKQKEEYFAKGKKILKEFYEKSEWRVPKFLEAGFHLKIGEYRLRGQIDRIDPLPDGTIELIDYKTGSPKKQDDLKLEDKEQLLIYQLAAMESLGEKPSLLSFYYLDNNTKVSFLGTPAELGKIKEKVALSVDAIRASDFPAKPSTFNCAHCDFKGICEQAEG
ncbi:MAG: UvrD-helicase domain-containing protein [Patescibacteria group bacterium]